MNHVNGGRREIGPSNDNGGVRPLGNTMETRPAQEEHVAGRSTPQSQSDPTPVSSTSADDSRFGTVGDNKAKEEALKILQKIEFEDQEEGSKIIYDVEPKFYSISTPDNNGLKFFPPVFLQRYMIVDGTIGNPLWSSKMMKVGPMLQV